MLTGYQVEIVAFIAEGEFVCRDCAHKALDNGELAELGIGCSYSPVSRYSIDEYNSERVYEAAEERVSDFELDHPYFFEGVRDKRWRLIDKVVEKIGDTYAETCGECGEVIS